MSITITPASDASPPGGGCLIATAAYGTELAPQVQRLREARDAALSSGGPGAGLVGALHAAYYALSPAVADMEREIPVLAAAARALASPALHSLGAASEAGPSPAAWAAALAVSAAALGAGARAAGRHGGRAE